MHLHASENYFKKAMQLGGITFIQNHVKRWRIIYSQKVISFKSYSCTHSQNNSPCTCMSCTVVSPSIWSRFARFEFCLCQFHDLVPQILVAFLVHHPGFMQCHQPFCQFRRNRCFLFVDQISGRAEHAFRFRAACRNGEVHFRHFGNSGKRTLIAASPIQRICLWIDAPNFVRFQLFNATVALFFVCITQAVPSCNAC